MSFDLSGIIKHIITGVIIVLIISLIVSCEKNSAIEETKRAAYTTPIASCIYTCPHHSTSSNAKCIQGCFDYYGLENPDRAISD